MYPSGSKDPFALRRAALGVIQLILANTLRFPLGSVVARHCGAVARDLISRTRRANIDELIEAGEKAWGPMDEAERAEFRANDEQEMLSPEFAQRMLIERGRPAVAALTDFFADRLKVQQREAGVRHDLIDAVFALGGEDDLVRL